MRNKKDKQTNRDSKLPISTRFVAFDRQFERTLHLSASYRNFILSVNCGLDIWHDEYLILSVCFSLVRSSLQFCLSPICSLLRERVKPNIWKLSYQIYKYVEQQQLVRLRQSSRQHQPENNVYNIKEKRFDLCLPPKIEDFSTRNATSFRALLRDNQKNNQHRQSTRILILLVFTGRWEQQAIFAYAKQHDVVRLCIIDDQSWNGFFRFAKN